MISLVRESSLIRFQSGSDQMKVQGIMGAPIKIKGTIELMIKNILEPLIHRCYVVDSLLRKLVIILGQDWLEGAGFGIQRRPLTIIPPYSEHIVKCKTEEKGVRFKERQLLQPGLIAAFSLVECKDNKFPCLIVN
jgi:hypothetical protein